MTAPDDPQRAELAADGVDAWHEADTQLLDERARRAVDAMADRARQIGENQARQEIRSIWRRVHAHVQHYGQKELDREPLHFPFLVELEHHLADLAYPGEDNRERFALPPLPPPDAYPPVYHPGHGP